MTSSANERTYADPQLNPGDEPYFAAATDGHLLLKRCRACGKAHHYPRALCPFCWSSEVDWVQAVGKGTIYSYSITRRGPGAPYCIAYVTLEEGPVMLTHIVDTELDAIRIGQPVALAFRRSENGTGIPMFKAA